MYLDMLRQSQILQQLHAFFYDAECPCCCRNPKFSNVYTTPLNRTSLQVMK